MSLSRRTPVLIAARRTPLGTAGHALAHVPVDLLAAPVLGAVMADVQAAGLAVQVDDVLIGNCWGPGGNLARVAALTAGLPEQVPAATVDRQCGSGLAAILLAASEVAGGADVVLAGGAESASTAPVRVSREPGRPAGAYERARFSPETIGDPDMGPAAQAVADACGIGRERQDAYALRSHRLAVAAQQSGAFDGELVAVGALATDERPRPRLSAATLARLRPAFGPNGSVTAGNSCGVSDGAAAVAVVSEELRSALRVPGLALRAWRTVGCDPNLPGLGPVPAVRAVLSAAGVQLADVSSFEITEAFAAQVLACTDALRLDPQEADDGVVCPQGGAIALGHPWGASGALLAVRLFAQLGTGRTPGALGLATCAVGGGQGIAVLVEAVG